MYYLYVTLSLLHNLDFNVRMMKTWVSTGHLNQGGVLAVWFHVLYKNGAKIILPLLPYAGRTQTLLFAYFFLLMSSHCCRLFYHFMCGFAWDNGFWFLMGLWVLWVAGEGFLKCYKTEPAISCPGGSCKNQWAAGPSTVWDFQSNRFDLTFVTDGKFCEICTNSFFCFVTPELWFSKEESQWH